MSNSPLPPSPFDAHPFQGDAEAPRSTACPFCGYARASILHHPSRIKASMAIVRRPRAADQKAS